MKMDLVYKLHKNRKVSSLPRRIFQPLTYCFMGAFSKILLSRHQLNIIGSERLLLAIDSRPSNQPLITVSNHHSCLDDFFLNGSLLTLRHIANVTMCRWCLTAVDICYTTWFYSQFCFWFRGIPVWRKVRDPLSGKITHFGGGVYQPSMDFCIDLLNSGQWIHVFPQDPIVLPIWHCGFDELNPSEVPKSSVTLSRIFGKSRKLTVGVVNRLISMICVGN
ncbi:unnamed protein product [Heterobilharzia americana]|nr:unnamed protein product [Heterobilharzia americana]